MLSPPDVQKILAGEKIIGSTRRNMGHVAVIVEESKSKKFDEAHLLAITHMLKNLALKSQLSLKRMLL